MAWFQDKRKVPQTPHASLLTCLFPMDMKLDYKSEVVEVIDAGNRGGWKYMQADMGASHQQLVGVKFVRSSL